jgi:hypothetical protein|tara:strand:- start:2886 stop:3065 length:180 start_codon:yes stop_codon:yes gene_type:complete
MSIFENNIKMRTMNSTGKLKCKCGSIRMDAKVYPDDWDNKTWIKITCRSCGNWLFYNGA